MSKLRTQSARRVKTAGATAPREEIAFYSAPTFFHSETEVIPAGILNIRAPQAWAHSRGRGARVALLDSGAAEHPDLAQTLKERAGFTADGSPDDDDGHGTYHCGIIAAAQNGFGVIGTAPECELYSGRVLKNGGGTFEGVFKGLKWCAQKRVHVILMPFGGAAYSAEFEKLCDDLDAAGILLIAGPAKNMGNTVYPGGFPSVLSTAAVAAINMQEAELYAPALRMPSTIPPDGYGGDQYGLFAAGSLITGVAALVKSHAPNLGGRDIRARLLATADPIPGHPKARVVNAERAVGT